MTRFGFLSTYPPTRCGLATFTEALAGALTAGGADSATIVRVLDAPASTIGSTASGPMPGAELIAGDRRSARSAVMTLNACDVAIVQHEYGIYGGPDGDEVVALLESLSVPVIVVLHTVLPAPSAGQRSVLEAVCAASASVVVMTDNARNILLREYDLRASKVDVIPHGVPAASAASHHAPRSSTKRVLTWGLISAGKGLEWGIRAFDRLRDLDVEYIVAGETHPKVVANEGERYREHLHDVVAELGLGGTVTLDDRYLDARQLEALVASADVVLLPYESQEQATSGVLAEAVAAGIPVVSTAFPHAVELLRGGAGLLARHADPASMAAALRTVLEADATARVMHEAALRESHLSTWPVVAERYRLLASSIAGVRAASRSHHRAASAAAGRPDRRVRATRGVFLWGDRAPRDLVDPGRCRRFTDPRVLDRGVRAA